MCCVYQTTQGIQCGCSFYVRFVILCWENVNAIFEFVSSACCTRACTITSWTKMQTRYTISCLAGIQQPLQSFYSDVFQNQSRYWTSSTSIWCLVFLVKWRKKLTLTLQFTVNNSERTKTEKGSSSSSCTTLLAAVRDQFTTALPYSPTLLWIY